jgi:hypothetical protein
MPTITDNQSKDQCFFNPATQEIISFPHPERDDVTRFGTAMTEFRARWPEIILMNTDEAYALECSKFIKTVIEVDEERYTYALECLPPENCHALPKGGYYFQFCERTMGTVTAYYVNSGDKFFTFSNHAWMKPAQVQQLLDDAGV